MMPTAYEELLGAAIGHLERLKSRGTKYIALSPGTLRALAQPSNRAATVGERESGKAGTNRPDHPPAPIPKEHAAAVPAHKPSEPFVAPHPDASSESTVPAPQTEIRNSRKAAAFAALRERVSVCVKCAHLAASRKNVVFGVGNIDAQLMFVGEAPGADEDARGEPFVGRAGELLTKMIQAMGLQRSEVYIANILKCRPDTPGQASGNRKPTTDEMATCIPFLHEQIDLIRPRVIVALGVTAVEGLLGKTAGIMKLRGEWKTYRDTPLMPTFHPAFLLRNQSMSEKRKVWEDLLAVMEKLEMPISEKQRNYFKAARTSQ